MDFNLTLLLVALLAGGLTILAPCVFTLLPVILGGATNGTYKFKPLVIASSTVISIILFTVVLRVFALILVIPESVWQIVSGSILIGFGIITLFPGLWDWINIKLGLSNKSEQVLHNASEQRKGIWSDIAVGAALGPVFTSCSPTYLTVIPPIFAQSFGLGIIYIVAYGIGLGIPLVLIGYGGQSLVDRFKWAADPQGVFKKLIGIVFLLVGVMVLMGWHKDLQNFIVEELPFLDITNIEYNILQDQELLPGTSPSNSIGNNDAVALNNELTIYSPPGTKFEQEFYSERSPLATNTVISDIDLNKVLNGGPPKDGIPAINNPRFTSVTDAALELDDNVRGILIQGNSEQKFYPYNILTLHEIVNDTIGETPIVVTFCPLCGSAITYEREVTVPTYPNSSNQLTPKKVTLEFGVSGLLYQSNLLMYDNLTESLWSQIEGRAVVGSLTGSNLSLVDTQVLKFGTAKDIYPTMQVLSTDTGFNRDYSYNPYAGYDQNDDFYFPVDYIGEDKGIPAKDIMYATTVDGVPIAFHLQDLKQQGTAKVQLPNNRNAIATYDAKNDLIIITAGESSRTYPGYFTMWFSWANHNLGQGVRKSSEGVFWSN